MSEELGRLSSATHRAITDTSADREPAGELALTYAAAIDLDPSELRTLGPLLLAALVELGLTPKARAALMKGGIANAPARSPLDELRARRATRQHDAAAVDSPAS